MRNKPQYLYDEAVSHHREHQTYRNIIQRCYNKNVPNYDDYGGRGITIADEWRYDAAAFLFYIDTELGARPFGLELDRLDNDGNYEPGNIRWGTKKTQANNRRRARREHLPARCKSGYKWVYEAAPGYWYGKFLHKGVGYNTSFYNTPEEASQAVVALRSTIVV